MFGTQGSGFLEPSSAQQLALAVQAPVASEDDSCAGLPSLPHCLFWPPAGSFSQSTGEVLLGVVRSLRPLPCGILEQEDYRARGEEELLYGAGIWDPGCDSPPNLSSADF